MLPQFQKHIVQSARLRHWRQSYSQVFPVRGVPHVSYSRCFPNSRPGSEIRRASLTMINESSSTYKPSRCRRQSTFSTADASRTAPNMSEPHGTGGDFNPRSSTHKPSHCREQSPSSTADASRTVPKMNTSSLPGCDPPRRNGEHRCNHSFLQLCLDGVRALNHRHNERFLPDVVEEPFTICLACKHLSHLVNGSQHRRPTRHRWTL